MDEIDDGPRERQPEFGPRVSRILDLVGLIPWVLILGSFALFFVISAVRAAAEEGCPASFSS
jgi:hypothetical protein